MHVVVVVVCIMCVFYVVYSSNTTKTIEFIALGRSSYRYYYCMYVVSTLLSTNKAAAI